MACGPSPPRWSVLLAELTRFAFVGALWMVPLEGLTASVVDDDSDIRKSIARSRLAGRKCSDGSVEDAATIGREQMGCCSNGYWHAALHGYDLIRRAYQRGYRIPMIAVTAFDTPEHRRQIFLHGFAYHLTKPFDPDHLVAVMGETVRTEAMRRHSVAHRPNSEAE